MASPAVYGSSQARDWIWAPAETYSRSFSLLPWPGDPAGTATETSQIINSLNHSGNSKYRFIFLTLLCILFNINAQAQVDIHLGTKGHWEGERGPRGDNHTTETHLHKNGSILVSKQEQGRVSSNLVITSGWRTPSFPMLWPRAKISAQRPGKNAGPEKQWEKSQCHYWPWNGSYFLTLSGLAITPGDS